MLPGWPIARGSPMSTGSHPNIAIASGDHSFAAAHTGANNRARATGPGSEATAARGDNNTATARGSHNNAAAVFSENGIATAIGTNNSVRASLGSNNTATATGANNSVDVGQGDNNTARARGAGSSAFALQGDGNTAIARGGCTASAISVSNMTVICPKVWRGRPPAPNRERRMQACQQQLRSISTASPARFADSRSARTTNVKTFADLATEKAKAW